jgi:hypothetical protein
MCKECGCESHLSLVCPECGGRVILINGQPKCLACEASPSLEAAQKAKAPTLDLTSILEYAGTVSNKHTPLRHGHSH